MLIQHSLQSLPPPHWLGSPALVSVIIKLLEIPYMTYVTIESKDSIVGLSPPVGKICSTWPHLFLTHKIIILIITQVVHRSNTNKMRLKLNMDPVVDGRFFFFWLWLPNSARIVGANEWWFNETGRPSVHRTSMELAKCTHLSTKASLPSRRSLLYTQKPFATSAACLYKSCFLPA